MLARALIANVISPGKWITGLSSFRPGRPWSKRRITAYQAATSANRSPRCFLSLPSRRSAPLDPSELKLIAAYHLFWSPGHLRSFQTRNRSDHAYNRCYKRTVLVVRQGWSSFISFDSPFSMWKNDICGFSILLFERALSIIILWHVLVTFIRKLYFYFI